MKKIFKIIGYILGIGILLIVCSFAYLQLGYPQVDAPEELVIEYTPDRIERGAYLANHVAVCMDCHSKRDFSLFSGPPSPGTIGGGGDRFDHAIGLPGVFYAQNITPFGISDYTDGELFRVITTGVTNDGRAMFPLMPYPYYGKMDREDIYDIIAYIRSIPSIENEIPESKADFPVSLLLRTMPKNAEMVQKPDPSDQIAYGGYLVNSAGCVECHTQVSPQGVILADLAFSGGRGFPLPGGTLVSSTNITPDTETGIGSWTEAQFVSRFKQYADSGYVNPKIPMGEFNSPMPWTMYSGIKEEDLKAIYAYLKTVAPIKNKVIKFTAAAK